MNELDAVRLNFTPESLIALDVILAFVLFGVALDMHVADFKGILTSPRGTLIGLLAHSVLCLLYTSPSPRDRTRSRMPSSA